MKRALWYFISMLFFKNAIPYPNIVKICLLRAFGAKIGSNIIIKPAVNIKYPWFLELGNNVWIGEGVWLDSLAFIKVGSNVCISQGAYILTGSHNYKKETFDLIMKPVFLEDGVWVGAKAVICPGVTLKTHSVINAGGVVTDDTEAYTIYKGNPASVVRKREFEE